MSGETFRITKGAERWCIDNGVGRPTLADVLDSADLVIPAHPSFRPDVKCYIKGEFAVSYSSADQIVLKVEKTRDLLERVGRSPNAHSRGIPKARGTGGGTRLPTTYRELADRLIDLGYQIKPGDGGHQMIKKEGRLIYTMPSTPSDHRGIRNLASDLRRLGIDVRR